MIDLPHIRGGSPMTLTISKPRAARIPTQMAARLVRRPPAHWLSQASVWQQGRTEQAARPAGLHGIPDELTAVTPCCPPLVISHHHHRAPAVAMISKQP